MKRFTLILVILILGVVALFAYSNRAWLSGQYNATQDCGCNVSCMEGKNCAIKCPVGKAAHCDCDYGLTGKAPAKARCYCQ